MIWQSDQRLPSPVGGTTLDAMVRAVRRPRPAPPRARRRRDGRRRRLRRARAARRPRGGAARRARASGRATCSRCGRRTCRAWAGVALGGDARPAVAVTGVQPRRGAEPELARPARRDSVRGRSSSRCTGTLDGRAQRAGGARAGGRDRRRTLLARARPACPRPDSTPRRRPRCCPTRAGRPALPKGGRSSPTRNVADGGHARCGTGLRPERAATRVHRGRRRSAHVMGFVVNLCAPASLAGATVVTMPRFELETLPRAGRRATARRCSSCAPPLIARARAPSRGRRATTCPPVELIVVRRRAAGADAAARGSPSASRAPAVGQGWGLTETTVRRDDARPRRAGTVARLGRRALMPQHASCAVVEPGELLGPRAAGDGRLPRTGRTRPPRSSTGRLAAHRRPRPRRRRRERLRGRPPQGADQGQRLPGRAGRARGAAARATRPSPTPPSIGRPDERRGEVPVAVVVQRPAPARRATS